MKIVAWRKSGELPADTLVMVIRQENHKSTKAAIKFVRDNPLKFEKDDVLEVIVPGKQFKIKETTQIGITWKGDKD